MTERMRSGHITFDVQGDVARITLERPGKLNALTPEMYADIRSAIRLVELTDGIEFAVIRGSGGSFTAGGDLAEVLSVMSSDDPLDLFRFEDRLPFEAMRRCSKVLIAEVNGVCLASGIMLISLCDVVLASARSTFAIPEGRVGLVESWVPALLFGRIPLAQLEYLVLTAKAIDAGRAEKIGLVTECVADEVLPGRVSEVIEEMRSTTPEARRSYKQFIRRIQPTGEAGDIYRGFASRDARERLTRFAERSGSESAKATARTGGHDE